MDLILEELGLQEPYIAELRIHSGTPYIQGLVAGEPVLFLFSSTTTDLAWEPEFVRERNLVPRGTIETSAGPTATYDVRQVRVFDRDLEGLAPVLASPIGRTAELPLPLAGHVGMLGRPRTAVLDLERGLLAMSWTSDPQMPANRTRIRLRFEPSGKPFRCITSSISYADADPPLPLSLLVSTAHRHTSLTRGWIERASIGRLEAFYLRILTRLSIRLSTPSFKWHAQLGGVVTESVLSPIWPDFTAPDPDLGRRLDGYVGTDLLEKYTCIFSYGLSEAWLLP